MRRLVRTGGGNHKNSRRVYAAMELFMLLFFLVFASASVLGLAADSRDYADWKPTDGGHRRDPRAW